MNYAEIKYSDIANGEGVRTSLFVSGCRRGCPGCFNSGAWSFTAGEPFTQAVEDKIIASLDHPFCDGLTVLGGEPMEPENQRGLVDFLERVRERFPRADAVLPGEDGLASTSAAFGDEASASAAPGEGKALTVSGASGIPAASGTSGAPAKTIWCFTGDTLDELMPGGRHHTEVTDRLLACVDILVDGPWVEALHDITLRFRGSSNQRIIDLNATRTEAAKQGCLLSDAVVLWQDESVYATHSM